MADPISFDLEYIETPKGAKEFQERWGKALGINFAGPYGIATYPITFTCGECRWKSLCPYSYDNYNTNGDCLADK